jgi:hypothetical protein
MLRDPFGHGWRPSEMPAPSRTWFVMLEVRMEGWIPGWFDPERGWIRENGEQIPDTKVNWWDEWELYWKKEGDGAIPPTPALAW